MAQLVDRYRPNLPKGPGNEQSPAQRARGFEWLYLDRFHDALRLTIAAQQGEVDLLAFSTDGKVLATSGVVDGRINLWEVPSGRSLATFAVRSGSARRWEEESAAMSQGDGRRVASLVDTHNIAVWDAESGVELVRVRHSAPLVDLGLVARRALRHRRRRSRNESMVRRHRGTGLHLEQFSAAAGSQSGRSTTGPGRRQRRGQQVATVGSCEGASRSPAFRSAERCAISPTRPTV